MTEANPPYLDFSWNSLNNPNSVDNKENRVRSSGFVSRITFTPRSERDFGDISCMASNGLDAGECRMKLQLGGPPNPPYDCYYKENNKTIIIECKPGFEQGDTEIYFYLLKKKSNGVLVEYARKRDSCSFLISNLILEEHMNDFYIYSSNKYGNNKEQSARITIENKEILLKNTQLQSSMISSFTNNKNLTILACAGALLIFLFFIICCLLIKCQNHHHSSSSSSSSSSSILSNGKSANLSPTSGFHSTITNDINKKGSNPNLNYFDNSVYKYSQHQSHYSTNSLNKSSNMIYSNKKISYEGKIYL
jgi:hypothetical protein